jgi:hypothetical protein
MSNKSSTCADTEAIKLIAQTAGTVRDAKLSGLDYCLLGTSAVLFVAGAVLLAKSFSDKSASRISKKMVIGILLMVFAIALTPIFNYLFACNPNAPLFS